MDMETFGKELRKFRKKAGLSQRDLAEKSGITRSYISKIEKNRMVNFPSIPIIESLAEALGIDAVDLIIAADKSPPLLRPIMSDPKAIKFLRKASGMISSSDDWDMLSVFLDEQMASGELNSSDIDDEK